MNNLKLYLKPFSFLPAIIIMYLIFGFSSQDGNTSSELSYKISHKIVVTASDFLQKDYSPEQIDYYTAKIHTPVRKVAHMTEYFALAISLTVPLWLYGLRRFWLTLVTFLLCFAFACSDEYHQSFTDGRSSSQMDVIIDSVGIVLAIFCVRFTSFIGRHTFFKSDKKKKPAGQPAYEQGPVYEQIPPYEEVYPYEQMPPYEQAQQRGQKMPPYQQAQPFGQQMPPYQQTQQYGQQIPPYGQAQQYGQPPYQNGHNQNYGPGFRPDYDPDYDPDFDTDEDYYNSRRPDDYVPSSDRLSEDLSFKNLMRSLRHKDDKNS